MSPDFTFRYPASWHVPASTCTRIELAIQAIDGAFAAGDPIPLVVIDGRDVPRDLAKEAATTRAKEAAAFAGLLRVVEVVVQELSRVALRESWSPLDLSSMVHELVNQRIVWVHTCQSSGTLKLEAFTAQVYTALEACPWWTAFQAAVVATTAVPAPSQADARPLLTVRQAAKKLKMSEDTIYRMEKRGEITIIRPGPKMTRISPAEIDRLLADPKYRYRR